MQEGVEDSSLSKESLRMSSNREQRKRCAFCYAYYKDFPDRRFFRFPKDPEMCGKWLTVLQRPYLMKKTPHQLHNNYKICSHHFTDLDFTSSSFCRLRKSACPSKFLEGNSAKSDLPVDLLSMKSALSKKLSESSNNISQSECILSGASEEMDMLTLGSDTILQGECILTSTPKKMNMLKMGSDTLIKDVLQSTPKRKALFMMDASTSKKHRFENCTPSNTSSRVITPKTKKIKVLSTKYYYLMKKYKRQDSVIEKEKNLLKSLKNLIPLPVYSFIESQLKGKRISPYGRRWSIHNKNLALQIYLASPKAYNILRMFFCLPTKKTLLSSMANMKISPGFCTAILNGLRVMAIKMKPADKVCIISFDEMKLKPSLAYDSKTDSIIGYESYGKYGQVSSHLATHALVFMIRGLCKKWKQVVGYFLSSEGTPASILKLLVIEAVKKVVETGLNPICIVCDQGIHNQKLYKDELCITIDTPYFFVDERKIYAIPDPPHLLKCLRNNFKRYNAIFSGEKDDTKVASWSHIVSLYEFDSKQIHRVVPHISRSHIDVDGFSAMKVSLASQIFSHSVAAGLCWLTSFAYLPQSAAHTAEFCSLMNDLFDSLNSRQIKYKSKPLLSAVTKNSPHLKIWSKGQKFFEALKFETSGKKINFPCIKGWILILSACQQLIPELLKDFSFILMSRFTQDALENFFSQVRKRGGNNDHPTPFDFRNRMRLLLAENFFNVCKTANCEPDNDNTLVPVEILSSDFENQNDDSDQLIIDETFLDSFVSTDQDVFAKNSAAYVAGYLVKQLKIIEECSECKVLLTQDKTNSLSLIFIQFKEFENCKVGLCSPSEKLIEVLCVLGEYFSQNFEKISNAIGVKKYIFDNINEYIDHTELFCEKHAEKEWPLFLNI